MPGEPITFFHRDRGEICEEAIYGEASLRWAYENALGRLAVESVVKQAFFSRLYGWLMSRPGSRKRIEPFIADYGLDPNEFADTVEAFGSFNDFFVRRLKPEARPIDSAEEAVVFPADGRHLGFPDLQALEGIYAKGQRLPLEALVGGDAELVERFRNGTLVISRLCPVDYHRFHFPVGGTVAEPQLLNGPLYSVSPIALRRNLGILGENKRVLTRLSSERVGEVLILEIGATNVGSIVQTAKESEVAKGDEKGYFAFGGSMTLLLFEPNRVRLADDLVAHSEAGRELYARMGDRLGTAV